VLSREADKEHQLDTLLAYNSRKKYAGAISRSAPKGRRDPRRGDRARSTAGDEHLVAEIRRTQAHPEAVRKAQRELTEWRGKPARSRCTRPWRTRRGNARSACRPGRGERSPGFQPTARESPCAWQCHLHRGTGSRPPNRFGGCCAEAVSLQAGAPAASEEIDVRGSPWMKPCSSWTPPSSWRLRGGSRASRDPRRGTGVLRRELSVWFRRHARVASFRRGRPGEGSDGLPCWPEVMISNLTLDRIREATDAVELISAYVKLRRRGQNYIGLCPFTRKDSLFQRQPGTPDLSLFRLRAWRRRVPLSHGSRTHEFRGSRDLSGGAFSRGHPTGGRGKNFIWPGLQEAMSVAAEYFGKALSHGPTGARARGYLADRRLEPAWITHFALAMPGSRPWTSDLRKAAWR